MPQFHQCNWFCDIHGYRWCCTLDSCIKIWSLWKWCLGRKQLIQEKIVHKAEYRKAEPDQYQRRNVLDPYLVATTPWHLLPEPNLAHRQWQKQKKIFPPGRFWTNIHSIRMSNSTFATISFYLRIYQNLARHHRLPLTLPSRSILQRMCNCNLVSKDITLLCYLLTYRYPAIHSTLIYCPYSLISSC
jgi:hypothetical protein